MWTPPHPPGKKKTWKITSQAHFRIIGCLFKKEKKKKGISLMHLHMHAPICSVMHRKKKNKTRRHNTQMSLIFGAQTHARWRTLARRRTHRTGTNAASKHKAEWMSPHSVSNCKRSQKPVPLGRGGVHQPAQAPARSPRVARVTLGLLPCHCLDQRGPVLSSRRWQRWRWA